MHSPDTNPAAWWSIQSTVTLWQYLRWISTLVLRSDWVCLLCVADVLFIAVNRWCIHLTLFTCPYHLTSSHPYTLPADLTDSACTHDHFFLAFSVKICLSQLGYYQTVAIVKPLRASSVGVYHHTSNSCHMTTTHCSIWYLLSVLAI